MSRSPPAGETSSATEHCGCPARRGWSTARRQAIECNSAGEQALSKTSLAELLRGVGSMSPKCHRHGHVRSTGVTTMGRLANKNILITGGNSGIGLAAAQEFDREGARVAICGLNEG